jgi:hypothetical protein
MKNILLRKKRLSTLIICLLLAFVLFAASGCAALIKAIEPAKDETTQESSLNIPEEVDEIHKDVHDAQDLGPGAPPEYVPPAE